jgi:Reverse transcriptase (RNA-dependent DNA polymerase)
VSQIHEVWSIGNNVASMLSLDISGAYDTVNTTRLLDVLHQRRIPMWIVRWIRAFMTNRKTRLVVQGIESVTLQVNAGVPQGSPLSPILFLFYNAELLEICNRSGVRTAGIGFVDDINILAYGPSTDSNCRQLERTHERCLA